MKTLCVLFFALLYANLSCQTDSVIRKEIGMDIGFVNYASIDELFTPFIYSGNTIGGHLFFQRTSQKSRLNLSFQYASVLRSPKNAIIPAYYNIISYDSPKIYTIKNEEEFGRQNTLMLELKLTYFRKLNFHFLKYDFVSIGLCNENNFIARKFINNTELIAISFNPTFCYELQLKNRISILLENSITLVAISIRAPYAGASAQLTDNYNLAYYRKYVLDQSQFDLLNSYLHTFSQVQIEKRIYNRLKLNLNYRFSYFYLQRPRELTIVNTAFSIGCSLNLGKK